jgi:hypothetical protein
VEHHRENSLLARNSTVERRSNTWTTALDNYSYPVDLGRYKEASRYPRHFKRNIRGDRDSTIAFEDYFRQHASESIEVYFEVVFWKLYSYRYDDQIAILQTISRIKNDPRNLFVSIER